MQIYMHTDRQDCNTLTEGGKANYQPLTYLLIPDIDLVYNALCCSAGSVPSVTVSAYLVTSGEFKYCIEADRYSALPPITSTDTRCCSWV